MNACLDLFDNTPVAVGTAVSLSAASADTYRLARAGDPATSHAAAARVREFSASHECRILAALQDNGPLTADGIAAKCDLNGYQVGKRLKAMERKGIVALTGEERLSASGRNERVWRAV